MEHRYNFTFYDRNGFGPPRLQADEVFALHIDTAQRFARRWMSMVEEATFAAIWRHADTPKEVPGSVMVLYPEHWEGKLPGALNFFPVKVAY